MFSFVSRFSGVPVTWSQRHCQLGNYAPKCNSFYWFEKLWTDACALVFTSISSLATQWHLLYIVSTPYSYSCRFSEDAEDQLEAAFGASQSLKAAHGTVFKVKEMFSSVIFDNGAYQTGSLCSMLYAAPGNILDWMYARQKIKYSYTVHLRDTGTVCFYSPVTFCLFLANIFFGYRFLVRIYVAWEMDSAIWWRDYQSDWLPCKIYH